MIDSLREGVDDIVDALDTGCTLAEVRASAEKLRGDIARTADERLR